MQQKTSKMDDRCLRKLDDFPQTYCPLAVLRLKALRNAGRELTEEEEAVLGGCPYAISHQMSNYCFFKYIAEHHPVNRSLTDIEIAHYNSISVDAVKKLESKAVNKLRQSDDFQEIMDAYQTDKIVDDNE